MEPRASPPRRPRAVGFVIAGAIAVVTGVLAWRSRDHARVTHATPSDPRNPRDPLNIALADARRCLLGSPLRKDETAAARLRAVELAARATPLTARAERPEERWPARCADAFDRVASLAPEGPLRVAAHDALPALRSGETNAAAARVWDVATQPGVRMSGDERVPPAPAPARPLPRARLQPLDPSGPADVRDGDSHPGPPVRLVVSPVQGAARRVCVLRWDSPDELRCIAPGPGVPDDPELELVAADPSAPAAYVFARAPGAATPFPARAIYPLAGGPPLAVPAPLDAYVTPRGIVRVLTSGPRGYRIVETGSDAGLAETAIPAPRESIRRIGLAGEQTVWVQRERDGSHTLRALGRDSAPVTIGPVSEPRMGLSVCSTPRGTLVLLSSANGDLASFFDGTHWSAPFDAAGTYDPSSPPGCHADHVTRARARFAPPRSVVVEYADSGAEHGARGDSAFDLGPLNFASGRSVTAAFVGDRVVLAWVTDGQVWMRAAATDAIARAPNTVLTDDAPHGGLDAVGVQLFAREAGAILVVHTREGSYPLRIAGDGVEPLRVARE